jgi:hypothetical protein
LVLHGRRLTGLALASTLRQAGRDVVVLDRQEEGANASRAAAIHAQTLQILRELNVTDRLIAEGVVVPTFTFRERDKVLTRLDFSSLPTRRLTRYGGTGRFGWPLADTSGGFMPHDGAIRCIGGPRDEGRPSDWSFARIGRAALAQRSTLSVSRPTAPPDVARMTSPHWVDQFQGTRHARESAKDTTQHVRPSWAGVAGPTQRV